MEWVSTAHERLGATGSGMGHLPRGIASISCAGRTRLKMPGTTMALWKRRDESSRDLFLSAQRSEADGGEGLGGNFGVVGVCPVF